MANEKCSYVRRAPGQKCQRCGADISFRVQGTKWCLDCAKKLAAEKDMKTRQYINKLKIRDTAKKATYKTEYSEELTFTVQICPICKTVCTTESIFCSHCGQRLKEERSE